MLRCPPEIDRTLYASPADHASQLRNFRTSKILTSLKCDLFIVAEVIPNLHLDQRIIMAKLRIVETQCVQSKMLRDGVI